jgi:hypothetical protein
MTSVAILLALAAFSPTRTLAKEPSGNKAKGHPSGGQQSVGQHGTGNPAAHHEASPNRGRTRDAGTNMHQNAGVHVNPQFSAGGGAAAGPDHWRYRSDNGRWWYWTSQNRWMWYGDNGRWMDYNAGVYPGAANAYAVERPVVQNAPNFSGGPIRISNPATNQATLSYTLDGVAYTIAPGHSQDFREDRAWVIQFSRGANLDQAQYGLQSGVYSFTSTDRGWELYRSELPR